MRWTPQHTRMVATYTVVHGLAEFVTALTLFSLVADWTLAGWRVLAYNALAFGLPVAIAVVVCASRFGRVPEGRLGLIGAVLLAAGVITARFGWGGIALLGFGSALLHIATGTATLKTPRPGSAVGIFESTGAVGLAAGGLVGVGAWIGWAATPWAWAGAFVLVVGGLAVLAWGTHRDDPGLGTWTTAAMTGPDASVAAGPSRAWESWTLIRGAGWPPVAVLGVLAFVSVTRSVVGLGGAQPWKQGTALVLGAAIGVALGRAAGGLIADWIGFVAPALVGFAGATLAWIAWPASPVSGLIGAFCLALPMAPVILALMTTTGRPSWSFGLAQLFQVPGAMVTGLLWPPWAIAVVLAVCAGLTVWIRPLDPRTTAVRAPAATTTERRPHAAVPTH